MAPGETKPSGNTKVTRQDWLTVAMDVLVSGGVEQVKVMPLAERLGVSRSSFYWYFQSRQDLLDALLDHWQETNTQQIVAGAGAPAESIGEAVCNVFRYMLDPARFNTNLDFAVRDWARRSGPVRRALDLSDARRLDALTQMFARFAYPAAEARVRARVLYYMQIGYNDAELQERPADRAEQLSEYLLVFTGQPADEAIVRAFGTELVAFLNGARRGGAQ